MAQIMHEHLKKLLQPDIMIELRERVSGPIDLLHLKEQLSHRLRSEAERQTAEPGIQRMIQLKPETWEALNQLADRLQAEGTRVTPTQVAALLIESSLAQLGGDARE